MSVKIYAIMFGIIFLALGVLGFVPQLTPNGELLGMFRVDQIINGLHILVGIIALLVAFNAHASRVFFRVFGIIFLFIAVLGIMLYGEFVFTSTNPPDHILHLVFAAIALYLGFGKARQPTKEAKNTQ